MIRKSITSISLLVALLLGVSAELSSQTKIILRPQLEEAISSSNSFYPHKEQKRPRIGLVLSGGGARGVTQIGVLKAFERNKIPIDFISATSLGAIVGGLYAAGYSPAKLESMAVNTDWDNILSLSKEAERSELVLDRKIAEDWSFLVVRFEGLQPMIPPAVSSGQRLTNFLNTYTLQALYHPNPTFDGLKIPFRAAATDLVSGRRIVMKDGSLAEALRASSTVPLLFNPIERESMMLVDGGLVSNIPVDIARDAGCDLVVAVNSTSGLRSAEELKAPWQTADQIMGIMMQLSNTQQLGRADIVITPDIGRHLSSDFRNLDTLIMQGEVAAASYIREIQSRYNQLLDDIDGDSTLPGGSHEMVNPRITFSGDPLPADVKQSIENDVSSGSLHARQIRKHIRRIYDLGDVEDVSAIITLDDGVSTVEYNNVLNPRVQDVEIEGCSVLPTAVVREKFQALIGKPINSFRGQRVIEAVLQLYRDKGYSLSQIESTTFDAATGTLKVEINEGLIEKIVVEGGVRTQDSFVLNEFGLSEGDVFEIDRALVGLTNLNSTRLFEYVYLEISKHSGQRVLTIRLSELPSQLVRFGFRADNERSFQGRVDIRDENFRGGGGELGLTLSGGSRNVVLNLEYMAHRIFVSGFGIRFNMYGTRYDSYIFSDALHTKPNTWDRVIVGEYADQRLGGRVSLEGLVERLGNVTVGLSFEDAHIYSLLNAHDLNDRYRLVYLTFGSVIDSRDAYPFPTRGVNLNMQYEIASKGLGSEVGYNGFRGTYESYSTWGDRHTIHPSISLGFADRTMPLGQQFRLGGRKSLFGVREDDRRGRQMLALSFEYRYRLPLRLIFDSYLRVRYDLASISSVPEEIKFATFRHGIGAELALDTPLGQAVLGLGKGFYLGKNLPDNPIQEGPLQLYFMMGYEL